MTTRKFLTLAELQNTLEDDEFYKDLKEERVNTVSDCEEMDKDIVQETMLQNVCGEVQLHVAKSETALEPTTKKKKVAVSSSWKKKISFLIGEDVELLVLLIALAPS
ncbi:hypothetical protein FQA39_LY12341 [Lamprigera yunnana]|nr:hypothetical protein FQA39_LY12341 [Lamprigera yunnana]